MKFIENTNNLKQFLLKGVIDLDDNTDTDYVGTKEIQTEFNTGEEKTQGRHFLPLLLSTFNRELSKLLTQSTHKNKEQITSIENIGATFYGFNARDDLDTDMSHGNEKYMQNGYLCNNDPSPLVRETKEFKELLSTRSDQPYALFSRPLSIGLNRSEMLQRTYEPYARNSYPVRKELTRLPLYSSNKTDTSGGTTETFFLQIRNSTRVITGPVLMSGFRKAFSGYLLFVFLFFCLFCFFC